MALFGIIQLQKKKVFLLLTEHLSMCMQSQGASNDPCYMTHNAQKKWELMKFADNAGQDQPAHLRRLIRAFVARIQNQWILLYMSTHKGLFPKLCIICFRGEIRKILSGCPSKLEFSTKKS